LFSSLGHWSTVIMWPFTAAELAPTAYDLPFSLPVISLFDSSVYSAIFTAVYVGSLYLSKASRIAPASSSSASGSKTQVLSRDHPEVIKARLKLVIGATFGCCFGVWGLVQYADDLQTGTQVVSSTLVSALSPQTVVADPSLLVGRPPLPLQPSSDTLSTRLPPDAGTDTGRAVRKDVGLPGRDRLARHHRQALPRRTLPPRAVALPRTHVHRMGVG
jgi:hypothetical protein